MSTNELQEVLANWIREALSPTGEFPEGTDRAEWVATCFARWWQGRVSESFRDAEDAANAMHHELMRLGGWEKFGDALHEHIHLQDALAELRSILGLDTT